MDAKLTSIRLPGGGRLRLEPDGWLLDKIVARKRHRVQSGKQDLEQALLAIERRLVSEPKVAVFSRLLDYVKAMQACGRVARKRGLPFELTVDDMRALVARSRGRCEVTGIPFRLDEPAADGCHRRPFFPSLDRIDNSKGYTFSNVRLVCVVTNYAMNEWGEQVLLELAQGMLVAGRLDIDTAQRAMKQKPVCRLLKDISAVRAELFNTINCLE